MKDKAHQPRSQLHTATAVADPVLVRIDARRWRIVLLAEDATYDHAHSIRLYNVRCIRTPRGIGGIFSKIRRAADLDYEEVHLRRTGNHYVASSPQLSRLISPATEEPFPMKNLSAAHYQMLLTATPRRLHTAAQTLLPSTRMARAPWAGVQRLLRSIPWPHVAHSSY